MDEQQQWRFVRAEQEIGPFRKEELTQLAKSGMIPPDTVLVDPQGQRVAAARAIAFEPRTSAPSPSTPLEGGVIEVPPPPPPPPPIRQLPNASPYEALTTFGANLALGPWNPIAIARLGIFFSPFWTVGMSIINGQRLGTGVSIARPLAICATAWIADLFIYFIYQSYLLHLVIYLVAVVTIYASELEPQLQPYDNHKQSGRPVGGWIVPVLIGLPGLVVVLLAFAIPIGISMEFDHQEWQAQRNMDADYKSPSWIEGLGNSSHGRFIKGIYETAGQTGINLLATLFAVWGVAFGCISHPEQ